MEPRGTKSIFMGHVKSLGFLQGATKMKIQLLHNFLLFFGRGFCYQKRPTNHRIFQYGFWTISMHFWPSFGKPIASYFDKFARKRGCAEIVVFPMENGGFCMFETSQGHSKAIKKEVPNIYDFVIGFLTDFACFLDDFCLPKSIPKSMWFFDRFSKDFWVMAPAAPGGSQKAMKDWSWSKRFGRDSFEHLGCSMCFHVGVQGALGRALWGSWVAIWLPNLANGTYFRSSNAYLHAFCGSAMKRSEMKLRKHSFLTQIQHSNRKFALSAAKAKPISRKLRTLAQ